MKRTPVLLDTNVLLLFGQGVDVFTAVDEAVSEPYELVVIAPVMKELQQLAVKKSKDGRAAQLALALVREKARASQEGMVEKLFFRRGKKILLKTPLGSEEVHADDAILRFAEGDAIVCTLDKGLQRRLQDRRVLTVRQKRFVFVNTVKR